MAPNPCGDVDWNKHHLGESEWEHRNNKRQLKRLEHYLGNRTASLDKPLAPVGSSKARPEGLNSAAYSGAMPPRSSAGSHSSHGLLAQQVQGRPIASPCPSLPPRTASTSLSSLWRRALSSPSLKPPGTGVSTTSTARERAWERIRNSEAWVDACESMSKEELLDLVEHVHSKIVDERGKRRQAETDLKNVTFSERPRSTLGGVTPMTAGSSMSAKQRIASRIATPAVTSSGKPFS
eukprot:TRINITY_DN34318_c0_g1_i1.p1 TRINITY_DN34318_c0_g1~~TRINITY_DN34318_c0_g1_i1.p1  ORF type:complete len:236 (+),score=21.91 TRINITY_DN34318_c0_g1_i1:111-818(+)